MSGAIGTWRPGWGRLNTEAMGPAVVALLVPITYIAGALVTPLIHPAFAMYLLQPLGWLIPAALVVRLLGDRRGELLAGGALLPVAVGIAALQTGLATLAGFLFGFGDSPYAHPLAALPGTLWFVCATVAGREVVRWYLARALRPCGERAALLVTAVLLWPAALAPAGVATLTDAGAAIPYLAREILPAAAASLFATALALRGGAIAAIAYAGFLLVFEWTAPVLPDLPWPVAATIGTMVPLIGAWWLFGRQHGQEGNQRQRIVGSRRRMAPAVPLVAASALALAVLVPVTNASWTDRQLVGGRVSIGNFCPIAADVKITPRVLDGDQENGTVTVHISFPGGLPPVFGEDRIETDSISLRAIGGGSVRPTDGGRNSLKFDKGAVIDIIGGTPTENTEVTFELRGQAGGCAFSGADTVAYRPAKKTPSPNTAPKSAPVDVPAVADPSPTAVPSTVPTPDAPDAPGETPTPIPTTTPGPTATPRRTAEPTSTTAPLTATPEPPIPTPLPPTPTPKPTATAVPSVAPAGSPSSRP